MKKKNISRTASEDLAQSIGSSSRPIGNVADAQEVLPQARDRHGGERCGSRSPTPGRRDAFVIGELQSLCEPCHNSAKRQIEPRGYRTDSGLDGLPTDPNHPFNRAGRGRAFAGSVLPHRFA